MPEIKSLFGREILDTRGRPTVSASCTLASGVTGSASVPSGASRGSAEAFELRDRDPKRYGGLGCLQAAANVNGILTNALVGRSFTDQCGLDDAMIALDGTSNKQRIGANAILAVSVAFARAVAKEKEIPLYRHFAEIAGTSPLRLPRLTINLFSGGKHAGQQVSIQDVLIIPMSAHTVDESLICAFNVYQVAAELILAKYGMRLLTADEGGLAPPCRNAEEMLGLAVEAIEKAGYSCGRDVYLGLDVAASHFYKDQLYYKDGEILDSDAMVSTIHKWLNAYPILSVEDGLSEDDWSNWPNLRKAIAGRALTLGDDLLCTNANRIQRAIDSNACDALLLKVNQVGTLTEALEACKQARAAGWSVTLSVRSGETEDDWAADLAVGWQADQFKNGSIRHSERLAKYNRLLEIEQSTRLPVAPWEGPRG